MVFDIATWAGEPDDDLLARQGWDGAARGRDAASVLLDQVGIDRLAPFLGFHVELLPVLGGRDGGLAKHVLAGVEQYLARCQLYLPSLGRALGPKVKERQLFIWVGEIISIRSPGGRGWTPR